MPDSYPYNFGLPTNWVRGSPGDGSWLFYITNIISLVFVNVDKVFFFYKGIFPIGWGIFSKCFPFPGEDFYRYIPLSAWNFFNQDVLSHTIRCTVGTYRLLFLSGHRRPYEFVLDMTLFGLFSFRYFKIDPYH